MICVSQMTSASEISLSISRAISYRYTLREDLSVSESELFLMHKRYNSVRFETTDKQRRQNLYKRESEEAKPLVDKCKKLRVNIRETSAAINRMREDIKDLKSNSKNSYDYSDWYITEEIIPDNDIKARVNKKNIITGKRPRKIIKYEDESDSDSSE